MSHAICYKTCDFTEDALAEIWAAANMDAEYNGDYRCPINEPLEKKTDKVFSSCDEAQEWIREKDDGWYWQVAVPYLAPQDVKYTKKCKTLKNRIDELTEELRKMENKIHYENVSSSTISCKRCGSRLATAYVLHYRNTCPVCRYDLRPETTLKRIKAKKDNIENFKNNLSAEAKRCEEKAPKKKMWLLKYEYHC